MTAASGSPPPASSPRCPICDRQPPDEAEFRRFRPFCSQRCRQVDLMRWIDGRYAIVQELQIEEEQPADENGVD